MYSRGHWHATASLGSGYLFSQMLAIRRVNLGPHLRHVIIRHLLSLRSTGSTIRAGSGASHSAASRRVPIHRVNGCDFVVQFRVFRMFRGLFSFSTIGWFAGSPIVTLHFANSRGKHGL
jgi:hypothetical protein